MTSAFILIALGIIFLLTNFDFVSWELFSELWRFWPLLLVFWGLQLLAGSNKISKLIITLLGLLILTYTILFSVYLTNPAMQDALKPLAPFFPLKITTDNQVITKNIPKENNENANLRTVNIEIGASEFTLIDNENPNSNFVISSPQDQPAELNWKNNNNNLEIAVKTPNWWFSNFGSRKYQAELANTDIPTDLKIDAGASKLTIDLDEITVPKFILDLGAGITDLNFGAKSVPTEALIDVGAGSIKIKLPADTRVNLSYSVGAGRITIDDQEFTSAKNGDYVSDGIGRVLNLKIDIGAGSASVVRN